MLKFMKHYRIDRLSNREVMKIMILCCCGCYVGVHLCVCAYICACELLAYYSCNNSSAVTHLLSAIYVALVMLN